MAHLQPMRRMSRWLIEGSSWTPSEAANETGVRDLCPRPESESRPSRVLPPRRPGSSRGPKRIVNLGFLEGSVIGGRTPAINDCVRLPSTCLDLQSMSRFGPRHALPVVCLRSTFGPQTWRQDPHTYKE
jgi:hypothetical protein